MLSLLAETFGLVRSEWDYYQTFGEGSQWETG